VRALPSRSVDRVSTEQTDGPSASFVKRQRDRATAVGRDLADRLERRRDTSSPVDLAVKLYERDRDAFASVLGSAIALRLFLFMVPAILTVVSILNIIWGPDAIASLLGKSGVTGSVASQIEGAVKTSQGSSWIIALGGLWLSAWAGRGLTRVLAACSAGSWRLTSTEGKMTLRMAGSVTGLVGLIFVSSAVLNHFRQNAGIGVAATGLLLTAAVYGVGWFMVTWTLPRGTTDPGALLPGAVLIFVSMIGLQWFLQFYLPDRISRASSVMGSMGLSVAVLGYLFFVGRVIAASLILDAVVFERFGSISEVVFALPVLRAIPRRSPRVARFFDLEGHHTAPHD
jgi:hypothetical protein